LKLINLWVFFLLFVLDSYLNSPEINLSVIIFTSIMLMLRQTQDCTFIFVKKICVCIPPFSWVEELGRMSVFYCGQWFCFRVNWGLNLCWCATHGTTRTISLGVVIIFYTKICFFLIDLNWHCLNRVSSRKELIPHFISFSLFLTTLRTTNNLGWKELKSTNSSNLVMCCVTMILIWSFWCPKGSKSNIITSWRKTLEATTCGHKPNIPREGLDNVWIIIFVDIKSQLFMCLCGVPLFSYSQTLLITFLVYL